MTSEQRGGDAGRKGGLRSALARVARRPFASLPSRIITSVFAAALVTSKPGGHGAVREAVEHLLKAQNKWDAAVAVFLGD